MKIYTAQQLAQADQETLNRQNITSLELMERAAGLAFNEIEREVKGTDKKIKIFCGIGNNGGDGLVIARKLLEKEYVIQVFIMEYSDHHSEEFDANLKRLKSLNSKGISFLKADSGLPDIDEDDFIVDAIFGIGLNRSLPKWVGDFIEDVNKMGPRVYAVDLPSGLFPDRPLTAGDKVLKAYKTFTFQSPKLAFFLPDSGESIGELKVLNIGLDEGYLDGLKPQAVLLDKKRVSGFLKVRPRFSHKGTYGHVLVVGGSYGMMGSAIMATRAALRSGAGKVTALLPRLGYNMMQIAAPEAMAITSADDRILSDFIPLSFEPDSFCFGTGVGLNQRTALFFKSLMDFVKKPMVIDADGLNLLSRYENLKPHIPAQSILTPHPGELDRLIGPWDNDFEKIEKAKAFVVEYNCVLLIKGACSMIITKDELYVNPTGNPGMATGGSGDVLTGLLAGLLAQGYSSLEAALIGVYTHGLAGDLAFQKNGAEALIAGDISSSFGAAFKYLRESEK